MHITTKPERDPVGDFKFLDAYMRWALLAAEEVVGKQGLGIVMRDAGLERLVDHYPPEDFAPNTGLTLRDYTALCTGLLNMFGRAGRGNLLRIGRFSTRLAVKKQTAELGLGPLVAAANLLPAGLKLRAALEGNIGVFTRVFKSVGSDWHGRLEERPDRWRYSVTTCGVCVERASDAPICAVFTGTIAETVAWIMSKEYDVQEVECRALGAPACVWEIAKSPRG